MNLTVEEAYLNYKNYLTLKNKVTTNEFIDFKFKNYILPFFGKYQISELSEDMVQIFQVNILKLNFSEAFYSQISSICNNFFGYLSKKYDCADITKNYRTIKVNTVYKSHQKKGIWTINEFNKFIKQVDNNIYHALFNFLFFTGVRKSEALALTVSDVKNGYVIINKSITRSYNGSRLILKPKSKNSIRRIKIDYLTAKELNQLINYYSTHYNNFNNNFYLFGGKKSISYTTLERKKNEWCTKANVKTIRIHDFRHSHATMLYNKNIKIKLIQERLGHASISTTLNTYVHTSESEEKKLIKMINFARL